jgi:hypothetical protein
LIGFRQTGLVADGLQYIYMSRLAGMRIRDRVFIKFSSRWFFAFALVECAPLQMGR